MEELELQPEPTPTPVVKKVSKKKVPCPTCPDKVVSDPVVEKVLAFRAKGYNNNQIASMLRLHKQTVDSIK